MSVFDAKNVLMLDPRMDPLRLLRVGRLFALNGDEASAVRAYREVILSGEPESSREAARCLDELTVPAWQRGDR